MSHEQRREILNELFFEGEERMPYVKQFLLAAHDLGLDCNHRPVWKFPCSGDRRHVAFALDDAHPGIRCGPRHGMARPIRSSCNTFVFRYVICFCFVISFPSCFQNAYEHCNLP